VAEGRSSPRDRAPPLRAHRHRQRGRRRHRAQQRGDRPGLACGRRAAELTRNGWRGRPAVALVAGATLLSLAIALGTRSFAHPDERLHVEAFRYFASHAWPPDLNADGLAYDPYGTSKVYSREIVYVLLGPIGRAIEGACGIADPAVSFRLLSVALLPLTLRALLRSPTRLVPAPAFAVVLAAVPQLLYVFGYANSDAWAVCLSVLLFVHALRLAERDGPWPLGETAALGSLAGLLLASKDNFLVALALPGVLLAPRIRGAGRRGLLLLVLLAALIPAPYKLVYPSTQPGFAAAARRMAEERAVPGLRPGDPGRAPAAGESAWDVLVQTPFLVRSAQSLWGVYGHMKLFHASAVYVAVAGLVVLNIGLTGWTAWRRWPQLPATLRRLLVAAPLVILANLAASLSWSTYAFYQPQGRYLFPSLLPACLLLAGTLDHEDSRRRRLRFASACAALLLSAWSLLFLALPRLGP